MDLLLQAAGMAGYDVDCLQKVFADYRITTFERLQDLPTIRRGRTRICGDNDVYKFISDIKDALENITVNSQAIGIDELSSLDEEE